MTEFTPVFAAMAIVGIVIVSSKLNKVAQPLRLKSAELGEQLLADPRLPAAHRTVVELELSHAFSRFWFLVVAFFIAPVVAALSALRPSFGDRAFQVPDDGLRGRLDEFYDLTDRIGNMNHPILYPALKVWLLAIFAVVSLVAAVFGRTIAQFKPSYLFVAAPLRRV